jgi:hypothetical protein
MRKKFSMKILSTLVIIGVTAIVITSCRKESKTPMAGSSSLTGNWELRQTFGDMGTINYPPGNGSVVTFTDSSYSTASPKDKIFIQGIAPSQGSYKVVADGSVNDSTGLGFPPGQFSNRLIFNDDQTAAKLFYQLDGDKLIVISGYFPTDGGIEKTYQKY